jgi:hypothetical protein
LKRNHILLQASAQKAQTYDNYRLPYRGNFSNNNKTLRGIFFCNIFLVKIYAILLQNSTSLLALVPLGDVTQIGSFIFESNHPRWARQTWEQNQEKRQKKKWNHSFYTA